MSYDLKSGAFHRGLTLSRGRGQERGSRTVDVIGRKLGTLARDYASDPDTDPDKSELYSMLHGLD